jgi:hypothetical protein
MKHLLNDLSEEEKNRIREQHTGGKKLVIENFDKLVNTKLGDAKPLLNEEQGPKEGDSCGAGEYVLPNQNYVVGETKVKEYIKTQTRGPLQTQLLFCKGTKMINGKMGDGKMMAGTCRCKTEDCKGPLDCFKRED